MRKLTDNDLTNIAGTVISGYHVEGVRIKRGAFTDADHYGVILGKNSSGHFVTWEFHLDEDDNISAHWGHYFENHNSAILDFHTRDVDSFSELSLGCCDYLCDEIPDGQQEEGTHLFSESSGLLRQFKVVITEKLQKIVIVEAGSSEEAKQIVSVDWKAVKHVLGPEHFIEAEFEAVPVKGVISFIRRGECESGNLHCCAERIG